MSKSVLDTIREYTRDPNRDQAIRTADLELDLCDRLVEMREKAGLTQRQLAERLGFTQGYVAKLENGAYDRSGIGTLRAFALALGNDVDLDHFFVPLRVASKRTLKPISPKRPNRRVTSRRPAAT